MGDTDIDIIQADLERAWKENAALTAKVAELEAEWLKQHDRAVDAETDRDAAHARIAALEGALGKVHTRATRAPGATKGDDKAWHSLANFVEEILWPNKTKPADASPKALSLNTPAPAVVPKVATKRASFIVEVLEPPSCVFKEDAQEPGDCVHCGNGYDSDIHHRGDPTPEGGAE